MSEQDSSARGKPRLHRNFGREITISRLNKERRAVIVEIDRFESRGLPALTRWGTPLRDRLAELDRTIAALEDGTIYALDLSLQERDAYRAAEERVRGATPKGRT